MAVKGKDVQVVLHSKDPECVVERAGDKAAASTFQAVHRLLMSSNLVEVDDIEGVTNENTNQVDERTC